MSNKVIAILMLFVVLIVVYLVFWHATNPTQVNSAYQRIDSYIAPVTGDRLDVFVPVRQATMDLSNQLSTSPLVPMQFKQFTQTKLVGNDSHGNMMIQNGSQVINSSTLNPNATKYLEQHPEIFANMENVTGKGISYGSSSQGTATLSGQTTDSVTAGQTYYLSGKLSVFDKTKCTVTTLQNGQQSTSCPVIQGPYNFRILIQCVDTDPYRCSWLQGTGNLPTSHQESNPDGTFSYPFQTQDSKYFVGNYNAHFWVETETMVNGQLVTDEFDHPFSVLPTPFSNGLPTQTGILPQ